MCCKERLHSKHGYLYAANTCREEWSCESLFQTVPQRCTLVTAKCLQSLVVNPSYLLGSLPSTCKSKAINMDADLTCFDHALHPTCGPTGHALH